MAELRELLSKSNQLQSIQTYIQSGNVIFESENSNVIDLAQLISSYIYKKYNFEVPVQVYNQSNWDKIVNSSPFIKESSIEIDRLYVTLLNKIPSEQNIAILKMVDFSYDTYIIINRKVIYSNYADGVGRSKMTNSIFEKKLKVLATSRNWRTMCKIRELLSC